MQSPTGYPIGSEEHPLLTNNPHALVHYLDIDLYANNNDVPDLSSMHAPRLFATHAPALSLSDEVMNNNSGCKIIYVWRNPKDCFVSLWHFVNKMRPEEAITLSLDKYFDSFCSGVNNYGPFWDHVLEHWKVSLAMPEKVMFLSYEHIIEQPDHYVKKIAEFIGCPFSGVEEDEGVVSGIVKMCSFTNLSQLEANKNGKTKRYIGHDTFFRRGVVGDSKNLLNSEMINKIDRIAEDKFSPYGLKI
uniref:Sulfotransferase n=1 Tax=Kalanchoe fedtschenkoi TaxID=63787 RepID=A0A7N0ULT2_KALFE